jgi:ABC-type dipeptide/oligopeptide/nickel transport system permease component
LLLRCKGVTVQNYIAQRLLLVVPTLIGVSIFTFILLRVFLPGDVIDTMLVQYGADPAHRALLEEQLGLDESLPKQYMNWIGVSWFFGGDTGILQGDFGDSLHSRRSILSELKYRLPVSLELGIISQMSIILSRYRWGSGPP